MHGLVHPDAVVAPYDETLNSLSAANRQEWAKRVLGVPLAKLQSGDEILVLAGARYRASAAPDGMAGRTRNRDQALASLRVCRQPRNSRILSVRSLARGVSRR